MTSPARVPVADHLELQQLIARYSLARDDKDLASLLGCFTADAEFIRAGRAVVGIDAIREFFHSSMRRYDLTTHTTHTQILDPVTADEVAGVVTGHAELVLHTVLHLASYRYYDRYLRTPGGWKIGRRELRFIYAMPVSELAHGFQDTRRVRWSGQEPAVADLPETLPTWF